MKKLAILALLLVASVAQAQKISADPTASTLVGSEYLAGVQSGANVKVLPSQIQTLTLTAPTTTGKLTTAASTTGGAGFRLPHGAAPTSPVNGDLWTTSAGGLYAFINGTTVGPLGAGGSGTVTSIAATVPSFLSVSGSPITTSGTLAFTLSGTALPVANGGTSLTTLTSGSVILGAGTSAPTFVAAGTSGNVLTSNGTTWTSAAPAGGGGSLTNWTEAAGSSAPNATIPVVSFKATNAATNVDIALVTKGTGGIAMGIADNTSTGGNKRGTNAVDLQPSRTTAAQVASGSTSVAVGNQLTSSATGSIAIGFQSSATQSGSVSIGNGNTSSGANSVSIGGSSSTANASNSGSFAGLTATASGARAVALGGNNSTASGSDSAVIACESCTATQQYAVSIGANSNTATAVGATSAGGLSNASDGVNAFVHGMFGTGRGIRGAYTHGGGHFTAIGDAQYQRVILDGITTTTTPLVLTVDQQTAATTSILSMPANTMLQVEGMVNGHNTSTGDSAGWRFQCVLKNVAGTVSVVGTCAATSVAADSAASTWAVALAADTTNLGLQVQVTGAASTTLHWMVVLNAGELK